MEKELRMAGLNRPRIAAAVLALALVAAALVGAYAGRATGAGSPFVVRTALAAQNNPFGAKGRTLGLSRVTIPAHSRLALHRHPGTQVAFIAEGVLTYTVKSGQVTIRHGAADASPTVVRQIKAGQTGAIRAGNWIVEQPNVIHWAANRTSKRVVVYLATLFPIGALPAIPVK
jgi:quercetin dioxygenase-like cupin family protein